MCVGSKDAGKNIVGGTTIDIEDLLALLGQYGSKCSRGGGGKTFCRNYNTGNTGRYEAMGHPLGGKKAVTFDVQARNDAHIGFFSKKESNAEVYEIVLSGWGNKQSVIREKNQGRNQVAKRTTNLLNGGKAKSFWADAVKGLVRVGTGKSIGKNVLMQWKDKNPHDVDSVGFMTGWGATGKWTNVCSPGVPATTVQKGLYFETYHRQGDTLASLGNPHFKKYGGRTPFVVHTAHGKNIWYSNDNDFKKEFNGFSKNDQYVMRWSGEYNAPKNGRYQFRTQSDDGSRIHVNGKMVVNNDGNHGPRNRQGAITLKKGWQKIVLSFYENGGGAMMRAWVAPPGSGWKVMTKSMFKASNVLVPNPPPPPPPPPGTGMWLEVYNRESGQLSSWGSPLYAVWNNMKPITTQKQHQTALWYSSDNDFKKEIKGFNKNDQYIMRWSGIFKAPKRGRYQFKTRSDDGSRLYINGKMIVNNDGNHGMRDRQGKTGTLGAGWHQIVVTFYENGGGAGLQASVAYPGENNKWRKITASMLRPRALPPPQGLYLQAYKWNGRTLGQNGNPNFADWNGQKSIVAHPEFKRNLWYSNDNDFKKAIPGFNSNDKYAMRWSGQMMAPHNGRYCFWTQPDDGSQIWVDGKRVVDNDGNHGPRARSGCVSNLKVGWHQLVVTFYENGGGAMMRAQISGPGFGWTRINPGMTQPTALPLKWNPKGNGMYFEAYHWNGKYLGNSGPATNDKWDNQKPFVAHQALGKDIWYSNDNDFKREINGFNKNDRYAMRWSGAFDCPLDGTWGFRTRSDDGSMLYVNGKLVVSNDGNHGMRTREGKINLGKGKQELVMTFYENGGGAGMQVSVQAPGQSWTRLTSKMTKAQKLKPIGGLYLEAFHWNGKSLGNSGNPTTLWWDGQKPIGAYSPLVLCHATLLGHRTVSELNCQLVFFCGATHTALILLQSPTRP